MKQMINSIDELDRPNKNKNNLKIGSIDKLDKSKQMFWIDQTRRSNQTELHAHM